MGATGLAGFIYLCRDSWELDASSVHWDAFSFR